jgi:large subunit ribosomal protein L6
MSRIGKKPITIPSGVTVTVDSDNLVTAKGALGTLTQKIDPDMGLTIEDGILTVTRPTEQKRHKALHGLYRSLLSNLIVGVSDGYKKELELVGVGYKATNNGNIIDMSLGYSHNIYLVVPAEIKVETKMEKGKNPIITLQGTDKQLIGLVAAKIKSLRKSEPYKGKGIKFVGEVIRRKAGKTAGKK